LRDLESEGVAVTARSRHSGRRAAVRVDEDAPVDLMFVAAAGLRRDFLNKPHDSATQLWVFETHERLHQRQAIRRGEEISHVDGRGGFSRPLSRLTDAERGGRTLEEEWNRHLKDLGDVLQAAGADAVGSLLILLDLLECQPEGRPRDRIGSYRA